MLKLRLCFSSQGYFKPSSIGVCGPILDVIKSLLSSRSQKVKVGSALSSLRPVLSGVQQGSVLGPILFILFINDFESCLPKNVLSTFFADDVKSYVRVVSDLCVNDFRLLTDSIVSWSDKWQLPLSVEKCSWMLLSKQQKSDNYTFSMSGVTLIESNNSKDLGIIFNTFLLHNILTA